MEIEGETDKRQSPENDGMKDIIDSIQEEMRMKTNLHGQLIKEQTKSKELAELLEKRHEHITCLDEEKYEIEQIEKESRKKIGI